MSKKLEEKRARRLERERRTQDLRSEARRRNGVTLAIALVVVVVVGALVYSDREQRQAGRTFGPAAAAAECEEVETFEESKGDHIQPGEIPPAEEYSSIPPTSGPMWEPVMPGGFTDRPVALPEPLHALEHGVTVVYYNDLGAEELEALENYANTVSAEVIAAPAPEGVDAKITMTAWRKLQSCQELATAAIDEFKAEFQDDAPESGAL